MLKDLKRAVRINFSPDRSENLLFLLPRHEAIKAGIETQSRCNVEQGFTVLLLKK